MHVIVINYSDSLFDHPTGDDAEVLRTLGQGVDRLSVIALGGKRRTPLALARNVVVYPAYAPSKVRGAAAVARLIGALWRSGPIDLIQAQEAAYTGMLGLLGARATGAKLAVCVFGTDPHDPAFRSASRAHAAASRVMRFVLSRADNLQTDSRVTERRLAEHYPRVRFKPTTPLTLDGFLEVGRTRAAHSGPIQLLYVGRLGAQKRPALLVDAFARTRALAPDLDCRLTVAGAGPDADSFRQAIEARGVADAVDLHGHVSHADLPGLYGSADMLVLTSRYEGVPRVLLEAAAARLPIVSTAVTGAIELEEEGGSVCIVAPDGDAFARAIVTLARDPERRDRAGAALNSALASRLTGPPPPELQLAVWRELSA